MSGIPLDEWVKVALHSAEISSCAYSPAEDGLATPPPENGSKNRAPAILSDPFLSSALRIAATLSSQISQAESFHSHGKISCHDGASTASPQMCQLPAAGSDWANHTFVFLARAPNENTGQKLSQNANSEITGNRGEGKFSQELSRGDNWGGSQADSLVALLEENEEKKVSSECDEVKTTDVEHYFSIDRAEIIFQKSISSDNSDNVGNLEDETGHIYSLGLVFYELFTGGKKPSELLSRMQGDTSKFEEDPDDSGDLFSPLPIDKAGPIDFASALQIMGALENDDESSEEEEQESQQEQDGQHNTSKKSRTYHNNSDSWAGATSRSLHFEALTMHGLTTALSNLIVNMIDCVNGDFQHNDSYTKMSDVFADLQLMISKPNKFLHDPDFGKLASTGLQFDDTMFGRDAQLSSLLNSYQRSMNGENEMTIVLGPSGTGKSFLVHHFSKVVEEKGGIFLSGKFDQQKQAQPFAAISAAFNEYCETLPQNQESTELKAIASELEKSLGKEILHLMKVIPNLRKIVGDVNFLSLVPPLDYGCVNAERRLQYLLCEFVRIISMLSSAPVTIFLDDLQWADSASISLTKNLLLSFGSANHVQNIFFVCCCRDNAMSEGHPVKAMVAGMESFHVRVETINVSCMGKDIVNSMISELLCLPPRLTRSLSEIIYHKTKGNALFVSRLVLSLCKEGVLHFNLASRRWEWDEEKIQTRSLPDEVATFFTIMIHQQPKDVQLALSVLSCFGTSTACSLVETLEDKLGQRLLRPLDIAAAEGFLDKRNGYFCFNHDFLQEAAYALIEPTMRQYTHFKYGLALSIDILEKNSSPFLFSCVGQLNRGGASAVRDANQGLTVANLNCLAGSEAIEMSDFASAFYFFQNGISFLPNQHWSHNYSLSLSLFEGAIKCALAIADFRSLELLSEQVMRNARCLDDTLSTIYISTCALAFHSKHSEVVEKGVSVLKVMLIHCAKMFQNLAKVPSHIFSCTCGVFFHRTVEKQLGEDLPASFEKMYFEFQMEQTKSLLSGLSRDDLLEYKVMTDPSKLAAMKFLSKLVVSFALLGSGMHSLAVLRMVQLSIDHGMSPMSPMGLAYYGSFLAKMGSVEEGCRFARIAKDLINKLGSKEVAGDVYAVTTILLFAVEPMQTAKGYFAEGKDSAMSTGDMDSAMLNLVWSLQIDFWIGTKLQRMTELIADGCLLMKKHNHRTWLAHLTPTKMTISKLIGCGSNADRSGFIVGIDELAVVEKSPYLRSFYYFHCMYVKFMFRNYDGTKSYAEKCFENKPEYMIMSVFDAFSDFMSGLISFWLYRRSNDSLWAERGNQCLASVSTWAESNRWNFQDKLFMLQAEQCFCNSEFESAGKLYEKGIASAGQRDFLGEEAIGHELAGYFHFENGNRDKSLHHFTKAHEKYHEWGAAAKAIALFGYVTELFGPNDRNG